MAEQKKLTAAERVMRNRARGIKAPPSLDAYVKCLVSRAPELTAIQIIELREIIRPGIGSES